MCREQTGCVMEALLSQSKTYPAESIQQRDRPIARDFTLTFPPTGGPTLGRLGPSSSVSSKALGDGPPKAAAPCHPRPHPGSRLWFPRTACSSLLVPLLGDQSHMTSPLQEGLQASRERDSCLTPLRASAWLKGEECFSLFC